MKIILIASLLLTSLNSFSHIAAIDARDKETLIKPIDLTNRRAKIKSQERINLANDVARKAISEAMNHHPNPDFQKLFKQLYDLWFDIEVKWAPEGHDFDYCIARPNVVAFNYPHTPEVYICDVLFESRDIVIGQTIVHEIIHASGNGNECSTTQIEAEIMAHSSYGVIYRNGYWDKCKIQVKKEDLADTF